MNKSKSSPLANKERTYFNIFNDRDTTPFFNLKQFVFKFLIPMIFQNVIYHWKAGGI